jgi:uncharacterized protein YggE
MDSGGGSVMKGTHKVFAFGAIVLLTLILAACIKVGTPDTLAAGDPASAKGGGGYTPVTGQFTEGLVVSATGSASADPEVSTVTFGVDLRGDDPAAIVSEATTRMNRAIDAVLDLDVAEGDIQTINYNLWVENPVDPETGQPTGEVQYHVSHYIQVTLRDLTQVGSLLADVVDAGANTVSGMNFGVEDADVLVDQARQQALRNARAKAQSMADALDISLGDPVLVTESGGAVPSPAIALEVGVGGGQVEAQPPSVSPGAFSVSVSVQVVYAIR